MDLKEDYDIRLDIEGGERSRSRTRGDFKRRGNINTTSMGIDVIKIGNKWYIWDI